MLVIRLLIKWQENIIKTKHSNEGGKKYCFESKEKKPWSLPLTKTCAAWPLDSIMRRDWFEIFSPPLT